MATETGTSKPAPVGTAVLGQLADLAVQSISPETARKLLRLRLDSSHHERVAVLSAKAREGTLTPAERDELDEYLHVADLLAILQSRARRALKDAGLTP